MLNEIKTNIVYKYYDFLGHLDITEISQKHKITIDWVVEAGCHDGSDTVQLAKIFNPQRYLAFEPDPVAFERAKNRIQSQSLKVIELYNYGLSNANENAFLLYEAEGKGSGSTHLGPIGEDPAELRVFDDNFNLKNENGLLWLDVEGHSIPALEGMSKILENLSLARIEVQLHTRSEYFKSDYKAIIRMMKKAGLEAIYGPIYPGFFGDIIFLNIKHMNLREKIQSKILLIHMIVLHQIVYPLIRKPKPY